MKCKSLLIFIITMVLSIILLCGFFTVYADDVVYEENYILQLGTTVDCSEYTYLATNNYKTYTHNPGYFTVQMPANTPYRQVKVSFQSCRIDRAGIAACVEERILYNK